MHGLSDSQSKAPLGVCLAEFEEGGKGEENLGQDFILFGLKDQREGKHD